jgi:hypothetical protein
MLENDFVLVPIFNGNNMFTTCMVFNKNMFYKIVEACQMGVIEICM